jgi:3-mercaptopyruvate sulfurtransferase SseA
MRALAGCGVAAVLAWQLLGHAEPGSSLRFDELGGRALVDARSDAEFMGWPRHGATRGGRLPGAMQVDPGLDLSREALEARGLEPTKPIAVYADQPRTASRVARALRALGFASAAPVSEPFAVWANDPRRPLETLPGFARIVDPGWVRSQPSGPLVILDCAWHQEARFEAGHVPGSSYFETDQIERLPNWRLVPVEELRQVFARHGIRSSTTVVAYGEPMMAATRVALALEHAGVADVRLLNGGLRAWKRAGLAVEQGKSAPRPATSFGEPATRGPVVTLTEDVRKMIGDPACAIVSIRSLAEQRGEESGYSDLDAKGRIKGDVWGKAGSDKMHMEDYEDPDGTLRSWPEWVAIWRRVGLTNEKRVAFYCGTGWRASEAWFASRALGWEKTTVYDPGWYEWGRDPVKNPCER